MKAVGEFENTWRKKDNTMAKRKRTKGETAIYKILHRKLKIEPRPWRPHKFS
jgi:hypothetical protein